MSGAANLFATFPQRGVLASTAVDDLRGAAFAQSGVLDVAPDRGTEGGTIAALCTDRSGTRIFLLTCGHVFLDADVAARTRINLLDHNGKEVARGCVDQCVPRAVGDPSTVDAALVEIAPETARTLALAYPNLRPATCGADALARSAALSVQTDRGAISGIYVDTRAEFHVMAGNGQYLLRKVHTYRASEATRPGDSGAAIWNEDGRLVGIHCGALDNDPEGLRNAFFCDIDTIVDAFGVKVVTREAGREPLPAPSLARAPQPVALPTPNEAAARELDVMTRTLWGEAGDLGDEAMRAVAAVILSRWRFGKWWGRNVTEVCLRPYQFRCWDVSSPAIHRMRTAKFDAPELHAAREIAKVALASGILPDPTAGATHYHPEWVMPAPAWAGDRQPVERIAGLCFYNNID